MYMSYDSLTYSNFTTCYYDLLDIVYKKPQFTCAPRGLKIKESLGVKFKITDPRNRLPYIPERNFSMGYCIAELLWYISGSSSTEWISRYSSFWSKISDDGVNANSAYGARIFKPHRVCGGEDFTQWDYVVKELRQDPDSRRAVIHIRSPFDSKEAKLDVPCTMTLQYFIRERKLHCIASMRSSDLILGIAYDVPAFTFFQEMLANELGVELGTYTHISNSLHIYENKFKQVEQILNNRSVLSDNMNCWDGVKYVAMPAIPLGKLPVEFLWNAEKELQLATTSYEVIEALNLMMIRQNDSYWHDWVRILAHHRLGKLQDKETQEDMMNSLNFNGYRFFDK